MSRICLVACASSKLPHSAPAGQIYTSALFEKSRSWANKFCDDWYVLSAKHGLLDPKQVIEPYNLTLNGAGVEVIKQWSASVLSSLLQKTTPSDCLIFLAGNNYRKFLQPSLKYRGYSIEIPLEGLRIGEQLQWLTREMR